MTSVNDHCPNCGEVGWCHLGAGESESDVDEFRCNNENCRVAYYEVELYSLQTGGKQE